MYKNFPLDTEKMGYDRQTWEWSYNGFVATFRGYGTLTKYYLRGEDAWGINIKFITGSKRRNTGASFVQVQNKYVSMKIDGFIESDYRWYNYWKFE